MMTVDTRLCRALQFAALPVALIVLMLGMAGHAVAQDYGVQQPSARQQLRHIHTPQSIEQKLASLTKDLELTRSGG